MYCSSCGTSIAHSLNYCNRCGAKLGVSNDEVSTNLTEPIPDSLVWAMVVVFIAGLGVTIGLTAVMKKVLELEQGLILPILMLCFLLIFTIEGVFIWLLLSRNKGTKDMGNISRFKEQQREELGEPQMTNPPVPPLSVGDNTTQSFDPVYSEPKSK